MRDWVRNVVGWGKWSGVVAEVTLGAPLGRGG